MALFKKKKTNTDAAAEQKSQGSNSSTLDIIKEVMNEENETKKAVAAQVSNETSQNMGDMLSGTNSDDDLKSAIGAFVADKSKEKLDSVMNFLKKPETMVCVPARIATSKESEEILKRGGKVKLEGTVNINPLILTDNNGVKVLPIFADERSIPDEIKKKTPVLNIPFGNCINLVKGIEEVGTIVVEPYTANIRLTINAEQ